LNIDDPVEACCVHAFGGIWGLIAVGFFDNTKGVIYPIEGRGYYLGMQIAGLVTIIGWSAFMSFLYFGFFKLLKIERVSISHELMGFDIAEMGILNKKLLLKMKIEVLASEQKQRRGHEKMNTMADLLAKEDIIDHIKDEADRSENFNEKREGDQPLGGIYSHSK